MSLSVVEKPESRANAEHDGKTGRDAATRYFSIVSSVPTDGESVKQQAPPPWPKLFEPHPKNSNKICVNLEVQANGSPIYFDGTAEYSGPIAQDGSGKHPADQAPVIDFDDVETEEPIDLDWDGLPIQTIVGEQFDPPITRPIADMVINVKRYDRTYDPVFHWSYRNVTNSDNFLGFPPGTLLLKKDKATSIADADAGIYFERNISIYVRRGTPELNVPDEKAWYRRVRAEGFYWNVRTIVNNDGVFEEHLVKQRATDELGEPTVKPALHQIKDGSPFDDGLGGIVYAPKKADFYLFKIYGSKPFSVLNIFG